MKVLFKLLVDVSEGTQSSVRSSSYERGELCGPAVSISEGSFSVIVSVQGLCWAETGRASSFSKKKKKKRKAA